MQSTVKEYKCIWIESAWYEIELGEFTSKWKCFQVKTEESIFVTKLLEKPYIGEALGNMSMRISEQILHRVSSLAGTKFNWDQNHRITESCKGEKIFNRNVGFLILNHLFSKFVDICSNFDEFSSCKPG